MAKYWTGDPPKLCDLNGFHPITNRFVDGYVKGASVKMFMCPHCHSVQGWGFGMNRGQEYTKQEDGRWLKTQPVPIVRHK